MVEKKHLIKSYDNHWVCLRAYFVGIHWNQLTKAIPKRTYTAGTWHLYVGSASMQRHDVAWTLIRRCINAMCLLGRWICSGTKTNRVASIIDCNQTWFVKSHLGNNQFCGVKIYHRYGHLIHVSILYVWFGFTWSFPYVSRGHNSITSTTLIGPDIFFYVYFFLDSVNENDSENELYPYPSNPRLSSGT